MAAEHPGWFGLLQALPGSRRSARVDDAGGRRRECDCSSELQPRGTTLRRPLGYESTASVRLDDGTTVNSSGISQDGEDHHHDGHLKAHISKTQPLRAGPSHHQGRQSGMTSSGRWGWADYVKTPFILLEEGDRLNDLRVDHSRATKSAGMKRKPAVTPLVRCGG